jgi:hypothetical protein
MPAMRASALRIVVGLLLLCLLTAEALAEVAGEGETQSTQRPWLVGLDATGMRLAQYYFNRRTPVRIFGEAVIPFEHPTRPTVEVRIGDNVYPMLFDTGTYTCVYSQSKKWPSPRGHMTNSATAVARLESKTTTEQSVELDYLVVDGLSLADVFLRDVPFRYYTPKQEQSRDYAGAISPYLLRDYVIEISSSRREIKLLDRYDYMPLAGSVVLPLLVLPRGIFLTLTIDGQQYWFHLDTGFSGELGVLEHVVSTHSDAFSEGEGTAAFGGWRGDSEYRQVILRDAALRPYGLLTWADHPPIQLGDVNAVVYPDRYAELQDYGVGGIAGSGLLCRFDYQLDLELGRLLILRSSD